jgi:hypothetical protein
LRGVSAPFDAAAGTRAALEKTMSNETKELKLRIDAKKHELLAALAELAADTRAEAGEQSKKIRTRLDDLELHLKDGWDKATAKLNEWLSRN